MLDNYNDLLTIDDLCEVLAIGKNTAYSLLNSNNLQAFRIGKSWKIPKQGVINYIKKQSGC